MGLLSDHSPVRELRLVDPRCSQGVNTAAGETNLKADVSCNHNSKSTKVLLTGAVVGVIDCFTVI